ncbi:MAG: hypothetical protein K2K37_12245 [Muribaculaceae bacterium]|nr:hypothetical protein [Muribaculaceae bacterium]
MRKLFVKFLTVVTMAIACAFTASAESFPTDGGAITLGTVYDVTFAEHYDATVTIPATGNLIQNGCVDLHLEDAGEPSYLGYGELGQVRIWKVEGGKTYKISAGFVMSDGQVSFQMEGDMGLSLVSASPEEGSELTITTVVDLKFNTDVTCSSAYLAVDGEQLPISKRSSLLNTLSFDISNAMTSLYDSGKISKDGGDAVKLVITDMQTVSGIKYGEDGVFEINYVAAPRQVDLVSYNIPLPIKSYYAPGDPAGILTFSFDSPVKDDDVNLTIFYGEKGWEGDFYYETIPAQVNGAVVTVDLTGKLRDINSYVSVSNPSIELKLNNIYSLDSRPAVGNSESNFAAYSFLVGFENIDAEDVACEFIPATGSSLAGVNEIEIWFNKSGIFTYDGVEFLYNDGGAEKSVVVAKADLDIQTEGDETTIHVAVPEVVKGMKGITVRLHDLVSTDGYNHYIQAEYDKFVVSLVSPIQPGQAIASTGDEDFVFDVFGAEKYFYLRYDFYNAEGAEGWVYGTDLVKQEDGTWTAFNGNFPCFTSYEPRMVVSAYYTANNYNMGDDPAETYEFFFHGTQIPFSYSDIKFESIDPAPNTELVFSDDIVFTVKFDGLVSIDPEVSGVVLGMGAGMLPFKKMEAVADESSDQTDYANTWLLYPDMSALGDRTSIEISIKAFDEDGKLVEGNMGGEEYDYLAFEYPLVNLASLLDLDITPAAGDVTELSKFVLSYDGKAVSVNYSYTGDEFVRIVSNKGKAVYEINRDDMEPVSDVIGTDDQGNPIYSEITTIEFSVNPAITEEGEYTLYIPANYFNIGDQFDVHGNAAAEIAYTIGGQVAVAHELTVTPEAGNVSALDRIDISAEDIESAMPDYEKSITITDAEGNEVFAATGAEIDETAFNWDTWEFNGFYIEPNIVEPGVYTLSIPAGMFAFADETTNDALTAVYTITTTSIGMVAVETADVYNVYTVAGVCVLSTADAADLSTLRPGLYIINGKKILVK